MKTQVNFDALGGGGTASFTLLGHGYASTFTINDADTSKEYVIVISGSGASGGGAADGCAISSVTGGTYEASVAPEGTYTGYYVGHSAYILKPTASTMTVAWASYNPYVVYGL